MAKETKTGRHSKQCSICRSDARLEIEEGFTSWEDPARLGKKYGVSRDALYRHAKAFPALWASREKNLRGALARIIEKVSSVKVNGAVAVAAISAYAKINTQGRWVDRTESLDLNQLFEKMSLEEMEAYANCGELPDWFSSVVGATGPERPEVGKP
jgi:hypothetical protein